MRQDVILVAAPIFAKTNGQFLHPRKYRYFWLLYCLFFKRKAILSAYLLL